MITACFTCMQLTAVGEMAGNAGLPSLDPTPRGNGPHRLSRQLSCGLDENADETFGCIYSGLEAIGVFTHALDDYRSFLEKHQGHRLFQWNEDDDGQLPEDLRARAGELADVEYQPPQQDGHYVRARLSFECEGCDATFVSEQDDWVKPFEPHRLDPNAVIRFQRCTARTAEMNIHDAEPFGILFADLDDWLSDHAGHTILLRLKRGQMHMEPEEA